MPSGSVVAITYDGTDITNHVLWESASFESQLNATPGTFEITCRDTDQTLSFITGKEITLTIDGQLIFGGYVTMVSRKFAFPMDRTDAAHGGPEAVKTRQWVLRGVDYNILFDKRVLRNTSNYLQQIPSFSTGTMDGVLIKQLCSRYLDIPAGFDTTTFIDNIQPPFNSGKPIGAWMQQGTVWRKQMEDFAQFSGALWYIDASKNLHWHALENSQARWGFSDVPNNRTVTASPATFQGATYGFRELDGAEDGSLLVNDALIWGGSEWAGTGGTVFARDENAESIAAHQRWELAEVHFGETPYGIQEGVNQRATLIVEGSPSQQNDQLYGLRLPQWQFRFAWYAHDVPVISLIKNHLIPGQLVPIILYTFGTDETHPLIQTLPLRSVRISFPNIDRLGHGYVRFDGFFGIQMNDPWTLWRFLARNRQVNVLSTIASVTNSSTSCTYGAFGNFFPIEPPDGSRTVFSIPFGYIGGTTTVFLNGLLQRPGADYAETDPSNGIITFFIPPRAVDWIWIQCRCLAG